MNNTEKKLPKLRPCDVIKNINGIGYVRASLIRGSTPRDTTYYVQCRVNTYDEESKLFTVITTEPCIDHEEAIVSAIPLLKKFIANAKSNLQETMDDIAEQVKNTSTTIPYKLSDHELKCACDLTAKLTELKFKDNTLINVQEFSSGLLRDLSYVIRFKKMIDDE